MGSCWKALASVGVFFRAALIIFLALPLVLGLLVGKVLKILWKLVGRPLFWLAQKAYVEPLQRLIILYVYPTKIGLCHLRCERRKGGVSTQHSHLARVRVGRNCSVFPLPCLDANYAYLVVAEGVQTPGEELPAVLVDPSDTETVLDALSVVEDCYYREKVRPKAILTTHKHWDHTGGNMSLLRHWPDLKVYACSRESVPGMTHPVEHGDKLEPVKGLAFEVLATPCHTSGHIVFVLEVPSDGLGSRAIPQDEGIPASLGAAIPASLPPLPVVTQTCLFSGDTLFLGSSGAAFEGSQEDMLRSLARIFRRCNRETLVFPGHEYTESNFKATLFGEPPYDSPSDFMGLAGLWWRAAHRRWWHRGLPTVPGRLGDEQLTHPKVRYLLQLAQFVENAADTETAGLGRLCRVSKLGKDRAEPLDFEVTPAHSSNPFVVFWRKDFDRHLAQLRACGRWGPDMAQELIDAQKRFKRWQEPWARGGSGEVRQLPSPEILAEAFRVLGVEAGSKRSHKDCDAGVLLDSLLCFGINLSPEATETVRACFEKGKSTALELAAKMLKDRQQSADLWSGFGVSNCHACSLTCYEEADSIWRTDRKKRSSSLFDVMESGEAGGDTVSPQDSEFALVACGMPSNGTEKVVLSPSTTANWQSPRISDSTPGMRGPDHAGSLRLPSPPIIPNVCPVATNESQKTLRISVHDDISPTSALQSLSRKVARNLFGCEGPGAPDRNCAVPSIARMAVSSSRGQVVAKVERRRRRSAGDAGALRLSANGFASGRQSAEMPQIDLAPATKSRSC